MKFFHLLLLFSFSSLSQAINQQYSDCAPLPYTCGSTNFNISYPFLLDGRPDSCGHPGYYVNCTNGNTTLTITISNKNYQITNIDYVNSLLNIVNTDFAQQSCPQPYYNTSIDASLFQYSDRDRNMTLFINCTSAWASSSLIINIPCISNAYYKLDNASANDRMLGKCSEIVVVPLGQEAAQSLEKSGGFGFGSVLQQGFYVKWTAGMGWCGDCVNSGGYCGYDTKGGVEKHVCFCATLTTGYCSSDEGSGHTKMVIIGNQLLLTLGQFE